METNDRELDIGGVRMAHSVSKFIDILDPLLVTLQLASVKDYYYVPVSQIGALLKRINRRGGVKSAECEKRMPHDSPSHSWNLIGPLVVSASESGVMLPRRRDIVLQRKLLYM